MTTVTVDITPKRGFHLEWGAIIDGVYLWLTKNVGGSYDSKSMQVHRDKSSFVRTLRQNGVIVNEADFELLSSDDDVMLDTDWDFHQEDWYIKVREHRAYIKSGSGRVIRFKIEVDVTVPDDTLAVAFKLAEPWKSHE